MIEARRLHILRAVADHRTVTAAAAALYLTPRPSPSSSPRWSRRPATAWSSAAPRAYGSPRPGRSCSATPMRSSPSWSGPRPSWPRTGRRPAPSRWPPSPPASRRSWPRPWPGSPPRRPASASVCRTPRATRASRWSWTGRSTSPWLSSTAGPGRRRPAPHPRPPLRRAVRRGRPRHAPPGRRARGAARGARQGPWIGPYPGNPCHDVVVLACENAGFQPRLEHLGRFPRGRRPRLRRCRRGPGALVGAARDGPHGRGGAPGRRVAPTRRVFAAVRRGAEGTR